MKPDLTRWVWHDFKISCSLGDVNIRNGNAIAVGEQGVGDTETNSLGTASDIDDVGLSHTHFSMVS